MLAHVKSGSFPVHVAAVALVLLLATQLWATPADAASKRYHYFQFNTYDNIGTKNGLATHDERADAIVDSLVDWGSDGFLEFASLNELCKTTAQDIVTSAQNRGLNIGGHFTTTKSTASNCPGGLYGNMVMHPGPRCSTCVGVTSLTADGSDEIRRLTCVRTTEPGDLRMCVTHITNNPAFKNAQIADVKDVVDPYAAGGGYIAVGGDFNQNPNLGTGVLTIYAG